MWRRKFIALGLTLLLWAAGSAMATPDWVQQIVWTTGVNDSATAWKYPLLSATLLNNCGLVVLVRPSSSTVSSVVDDAGNTYSLFTGSSITDTGNGIITEVWKCYGMAAGGKVLTVTMSAAVNIRAAFSEWYNIATSAADDGHNGIAQNITGGAVVSGSFNTTIDGDLIIHIGNDTDNGIQISGRNDGLSNIAPASGYTLLTTHSPDGTFVEYLVQATHGATNPSATVTCTASPLDWTSITIALKSASAGTAPSATAQRVCGAMHIATGNLAGGSGTGTWHEQFPTRGNHQIMMFSDPAGAIAVTGVTDTPSNTWNVYSPDTGCPSSAWQQGGAANSNNKFAITVTDPATHGYIQGVIYDSVNVGPHDTNVFKTNGSFSTPGNSATSPAITPGVPAGIVYNCTEYATGPPDSLVTPSGATFMCVYYTGMIDTSGTDNGDCHGFDIFSTNAIQNWVYHDVGTPATGGTSSSANGIALSFGTLAAGSAIVPAPIDPQFSPKRFTQIDLTRNVAVAAPAETTLVGQSCL